MGELVSGRHAVYHLLAAGRRKVHRLYLQRGIEKREPDLVGLAKKKQIPISTKEAAFFVNTKEPVLGHQGILAETEDYPYVDFDELLPGPCLLILDEIQDPQNLGALCRSAHLFGVDGVIIPETHSASIGSGACQASVGAVEYLKIARVSSISSALEILKKHQFWVYGTDPEAPKGLHEEVFPEKVAIVIGSEEKGLRRLVRERCDILLKIPMPRKVIGSLNASVAGGVFLYEIVRQNRLKK